MDQTKALNALEPFLALTKSASSPRAAADLIARATSHPHVFVFSELLVTPQIQALRNDTTYGSSLRLLEIFSYGTYAEYTSSASAEALPELNDTQRQKLKQLTLMTLARDPAHLTYKNLLSVLDLESTRALEDLVISAIYAGLVSGTLDPQNQRVAITSVAALRDVAPGSVPSMLSTLKDWSARCAATLEELEAEVALTKQRAQQRHDETQRWDSWFEKASAEVLKAENGQVEQGKDGHGKGGHGIGGIFNWRSRTAVSGGPGKRNMEGMLQGNDGGSMDIDDDEAEKQRRGGKLLKKRGSVANSS